MSSFLYFIGCHNKRQKRQILKIIAKEKTEETLILLKKDTFATV